MSLDGTYNVILADPPWRYEQYSIKPSLGIENYYPTMELTDIKNLITQLPIEKDAIIFLWATAPKLEEALEVMRAWDFTYRSCAIWDKEHLGLGYYFRVQHELLLIGKRGKKMKTPHTDNRPRSVIREKRTSHSTKPRIVYEYIEKMYPNQRYLELFARREREGWGSWGAGIDKIEKNKRVWWKQTKSDE